MTTISDISYISDIHLEFKHILNVSSFLRRIAPPSPNNIAILAGDIGNPYSEQYKICMAYFNASFKRTYVVAGNHEFYSNGKTIDDTLAYLRLFFEDYPNMCFLENNIDVYEGHVFVGATLWSHIENPDYLINDWHYIKGYSIEDNNRRHTESRDFIERTLTRAYSGKTVVITHHLPSYKLIEAKYTGSSSSAYNQCFASDLDNIIEEGGNNIETWIYGHTHTASDQVLLGTKFLCNPVGYQGENKPSAVYIRTYTFGE